MAMPLAWLSALASTAKPGAGVVGDLILGTVWLPIGDANPKILDLRHRNKTQS
jgi:hypothetical protein